MLFSRLTITNFGVFKGTHDFELLPRISDGKQYNLIVFSGHNGAGKTTLFQAFSLALQGQTALGNRVSTQSYNDYILARIHRNTLNPWVNAESGVKVVFQYTRSGQTTTIEVERKWQKINSERVKEVLTILQNDQPLDIDLADYQIWLNDIFPYGLASICFFDAERLDNATATENHSKLLSETVNKLLGLDIVQRLQSDLDHYTLRSGSVGKIEEIRSQIAKYQIEVDNLEAQLSQNDAETKVVTASIKEIDNEILDQEHQLAAEGGSFAARRPVWQERIAVIQKDITKLSDELREMTNELLPFALAPELCQMLNERLEEEIHTQQLAVARSVWQNNIPLLKDKLQRIDIWRGLDITQENAQEVVVRFIKFLNDESFQDISFGEVIHQLSSADRKRLQVWISQVLSSIPRIVKNLGEQLHKLQEEQSNLLLNLQRTPDDELLKPIHNQIQELQKRKALAEKQEKKLIEQAGSLSFQEDEQKRLLQRSIEQLNEVQKIENQLVLVDKSKAALRTYKDVLLRQQLLIFEKALVRTFNQLCHKEHLLAAAKINAETYEVELLGAKGQNINLEGFSAGERQLYIMSLLRAAREVSGRQLPLAIDTPLARLDEEHRLRLVEEFFPHSSSQVILFVTDAELNSGLIELVKPYLTRLYILRYDAELGGTIVTGEDFLDDYLDTLIKA